jgi:hypothetical protein
MAALQPESMLALAVIFPLNKDSISSVEHARRRASWRGSHDLRLLGSCSWLVSVEIILHENDLLCVCKVNVGHVLERTRIIDDIGGSLETGQVGG